MGQLLVERFPVKKPLLTHSHFHNSFSPFKKKSSHLKPTDRKCTHINHKNRRKRRKCAKLACFIFPLPTFPLLHIKKKNHSNPQTISSPCFASKHQELLPSLLPTKFNRGAIMTLLPLHNSSFQQPTPEGTFLRKASPPFQAISYCNAEHQPFPAKAPFNGSLSSPVTHLVLFTCMNRYSSLYSPLPLFFFFSFPPGARNYSLMGNVVRTTSAGTACIDGNLPLQQLWVRMQMNTG